MRPFVHLPPVCVPRFALLVSLLGAPAQRNPDSSVARSRTRVFDALSRLQQAIGAAGQTTEYVYDAQGNPTTITDPKEQTTGQVYDARHRLTQVTDALSGLSTLTYDRQDRVTGLTAPNGAATAYTYDGLGNLTQEQSPDRGTTGATYDAAGNVLTRTDARGVTVTYTYDALNRPLSETWSSGETVKLHLRCRARLQRRHRPAVPGAGQCRADHLRLRRARAGGDRVARGGRHHPRHRLHLGRRRAAAGDGAADQ